MKIKILAVINFIRRKRNNLMNINLPWLDLSSCLMPPLRAPTDAATRQPLDGKSVSGGMRLGELPYPGY